MTLTRHTGNINHALIDNLLVYVRANINEHGMQLSMPMPFECSEEELEECILICESINYLEDVHIQGLLDGKLIIIGDITLLGLDHIKSIPPDHYT